MLTTGAPTLSVSHRSKPTRNLDAEWESNKTAGKPAHTHPASKALTGSGQRSPATAASAGLLSSLGTAAFAGAACFAAAFGADILRAGRSLRDSKHGFFH